MEHDEPVATIACGQTTLVVRRTLESWVCRLVVTWLRAGGAPGQAFVGMRVRQIRELRDALDDILADEQKRRHARGRADRRRAEPEARRAGAPPSSFTRGPL